LSHKPGLTTLRKKGWESQLDLKFLVHTKHSKTVRYRAPLGERFLDLYVPRFMLEEVGQIEPPQGLQVAIDPSHRSQRTIGFRGSSRPLAAELGVCEFEFAEAMVNSTKYHMSRGKHLFSLYIPSNVFGGAAPPARVFLRIATL
jgi:hypothetical protein